MTRVILFSGKGGTGKTTVSAATAARAAALGKRTLLASADLAHNLADLFELSGPGPWTAAPRLTVREVDPLAEMESEWGSLRGYLAELARYFGLQTAMAEEILLLPGVAEFFILSSVLGAAESGEYDLVVVDCGPTADTMRLLGLADSASGRIRGFLKLQRDMVGLMRPFQRRIEVPLPAEAALDELPPLADRADRVRRMLTDGKSCSVRLVLNPDALAIAETRRLYTYLNLFGLAVDAVVVNKKLPDECRRGFLSGRFKEQARRMTEIEQSFGGPKLLTAPLADLEPRGLAALADFGARLYPGDPASVLARSAPFSLTPTDSGACLRLPLPGADKSTVSVKQQGPHLAVKVGSFVRLITLPDSLARATVERARMENGELALDCK